MPTIPNPTLADLLDQDRRRNLTPTQLRRLLAQLQTLNTAIAAPTAKDLPSTPGEFATQFSRTTAKWKPYPHLELLSEYLSDLEAKRNRFLLVSTPPRHGKSLIMSYWFPLWLLARDPSRRIALVSYSAETAEVWGRQVRNFIRDRGPEIGLHLDETTRSAGNWSLTTGGGMISIGVGGPLTGRKTHCVIIDDPVRDDEEASSVTMREKLWNWWQTVALSRVDADTFCACIMTRWHQEDLIGKLEKISDQSEIDVQEGRPPRGIIWKSYRLPALAEENDPLGREIGAPLCPELIPFEVLQLKKSGMSPYNWSATHQQRPSPEGGGAIKQTWWKFYQVPPAEFDEVIQSWDLTFMDAASSDFVVGQVWGRKGATYYLLDQVRARMDAPETLAQIHNLTRKHPAAHRKLIENKANGPAVVALLSKEVHGIIPVRVRGAKEARLGAVSVAIEAGNVYIPHPDVQHWVTDFLDECSAFPKGKNDDQVDALSQGLAYLLHGGRTSIDRAWDEAKEGPPVTDQVEIHNASLHAAIKKETALTERALRDSLYSPLTPRRFVRSW